MAQVVLQLAFLGALAACGDDPGTGSDSLSPGSGDVPITSKAIAAVTLEHVPHTPHVFTTSTDKEDPDGMVGADLRYDPTGESDGGLLRVVVSPTLEEDPCGEHTDGCERRQVEGGELVVVWQLEEPEEDGGFLAVVMLREDEVVYAYNAAETITKDPRDMELRFPVELLEEIVTDQRLGLTTSQAAVDAGEQIPCWRGGLGGPCEDGGPLPDESGS